MFELLASLDDRSFARLLVAIGRGTIAPLFPSTIVDDRDPVMLRLAQEYRASGGFNPRPKKPGKPPDWHQHLVLDAKGKPEKGVVNAIIAMREDPAISGVLGYDRQLRKVVLKGRLPDDWEPTFEMRAITAPDLLSLYEYLTRGGFRLTKDEMKAAVVRIAKENPLGESE